jgi:hypothetical protein
MQSSKDKTSEKKSQKPKLGLTLSIGVISSIPCHNPFKHAFERAVADAGVNLGAPPTYYDDIGYGGDYKTPIGNLNDDNTIGLIVTLGGMIAFKAASTFAKKPFISLVGGPPAGGLPSPGIKPLNNYFYGGVSLESYAGNSARIAHLGGPPHKFAPKDITLLYNPNSVIAPDELANWTGGPVLAKGDNKNSTYSHAFTAILTPAVIVSADPIFHKHRENLIEAANDSYEYMCYPLQNYRNDGGTNQPAPGRTTIYGPKLEHAISTLGQMAATVISTGLTAPDEVFIRLGAPVDL